jgi:hypothetical protein
MRRHVWSSQAPVVSLISRCCCGCCDGVSCPAIHALFLMCDKPRVDDILSNPICCACCGERAARGTNPAHTPACGSTRHQQLSVGHVASALPAPAAPQAVAAQEQREGLTATCCAAAHGVSLATACRSGGTPSPRPSACWRPSGVVRLQLLPGLSSNCALCAPISWGWLRAGGTGGGGPRRPPQVCAARGCGSVGATATRVPHMPLFS